MPMPIRSGSSSSSRNDAFSSSIRSDIIRAAASAPRLPPCGTVVDSEQRHNPVPEEFIDPAAGTFDRAPDRGKIAVQDEDHVVGQPAFGKCGKAANVGKHDRDLAFPPLRDIDPAPAVHRIGKGRQQRRNLDFALRPQLTGEPDIGCGAYAAQHPPLRLARRIDASRLCSHPHAAGRAATASTADVCVRDASKAARLEHAGAGHHLDKAAVGIVDSDQAVTPLPQAAGESRQQNRDHNTRERPAKRPRDGIERLLRFRRRQATAGQRLLLSRRDRRQGRQFVCLPR